MHAEPRKGPAVCAKSGVKAGTTTGWATTFLARVGLQTRRYGQRWSPWRRHTCLRVVSDIFSALAASGCGRSNNAFKSSMATFAGGRPFVACRMQGSAVGLPLLCRLASLVPLPCVVFAIALVSACLLGACSPLILAQAATAWSLRLSDCNSCSLCTVIGNPVEHAHADCATHSC